MKVSDAIEWLSTYDGDTELGVVATFPGLDGWKVASWAITYGEAEGLPVLEMDVYEADFDYPSFERASNQGSSE